MQKLIAVLLVGLGALFLPQAQSTGAAQDEAGAHFEQVELTPDIIKRFLTSFVEIKKVGKRYRSRIDQSDPGDSDPIGAASAFMKDQKARVEIEKVLNANGFSTFQQWRQVGQSLAIAYGSVKSNRSPRELEQQAEQAIGLIQRNDRLSDRQKQRMIALMRQQMGAISRFAPLPGNVEVVRGMMDEIAPVMDSD